MRILEDLDQRLDFSQGEHTAVREISGSCANGYDCLIVGAGFAGSVIAERLAAGYGQRVLVADRRSHIGGNAYDEYNRDGLLVHRYGPHIFHTNAQRVVDYLSRFTEWRPYKHRVLALVEGMLLPVPINLTTINRLYSLELSPEQAKAFLAERSEAVADIRTSEDAVVSKIGRDLYEKFFRGYTRKQWGMDPSQLDRSVTSRVPVRTTTEDGYFDDEFQCMPLEGYTRMFEKMLAHPKIKVMLNTDYKQIRNQVQYRRVVYTGPIDEYFDHCLGKLPYRSLEFRHETLDQEYFQSLAVVNYPSEEVHHTRITEYKYLTGQKHAKTSITYEYPSDKGDPYYPIPRRENVELFRRYQALADQNPEVTFAGRLGSYRYYNMDQVVAQALSTVERIVATQEATKRTS
jgi:UDP-galactopyranose mutase